MNKKDDNSKEKKSTIPWYGTIKPFSEYGLIGKIFYPFILAFYRPVLALTPVAIFLLLGNLYIHIGLTQHIHEPLGEESLAFDEHIFRVEIQERIKRCKPFSYWPLPPISNQVEEIEPMFESAFGLCLNIKIKGINPMYHPRVSDSALYFSIIENKLMQDFIQLKSLSSEIL